MKVVVFGATGNVGSALLRRLEREDEITEIRAVARREARFSSSKVRFTRLNVAEDDLSGVLAGADAVVHLAWQFHPTRRPVLTWRANVEGGIRIFDATAQAGVHNLIYASSIGTYAPAQSREPVEESWPTDAIPAAAYGREKAYLERVLDAFELRVPDCRVVRMRPAFVFQHASASQQRRIFAGPFVPTTLLEPGRLPVLVFPKAMTFQALHADDAADAFFRALVSDVRGPFNLAAEPLVDGAALAGLLGTRLVEVPPLLVRGALRLAWFAHLVPVEPGLFDLACSLPVISAERARRELGWEPVHSSLDALAEMLKGLVSGGGGETEPLAPDSLASRLKELRAGLGRQG